MLHIIIYLCIFVAGGEFHLSQQKQDNLTAFYKLRMETIRDRIVKIMEVESLTASRFAESIGIQRGAMSHILSGRNNPSLDVITKILAQYVQISPDWLLFGKGDMKRLPDQGNASFKPTEKSLNTNEPSRTLKNREENNENISLLTPKSTVVEKVIIHDKPSKIIKKIMVFYSDNTFDTFVPETDEKI